MSVWREGFSRAAVYGCSCAKGKREVWQCKAKEMEAAKAAKDFRLAAGRFFLPLALFSFCSSIRLKNIPGISIRFSMRRRAVKCLFHQYFRLYPQAKAEPPLWPNCAFCSLRIQTGPKPCIPGCLSALPHLITTCRMAVSFPARFMRLSRQRKLRSQPLSVLA
jgi:hypothetical protein